MAVPTRDKKRPSSYSPKPDRSALRGGRSHSFPPACSFFYWSTNQELNRIILSAVRMLSESCPPSLSETPQTLASLSSLVTFTIEQGDGIYLLGDFNCTTSSPPQVNQSVLLADFSGIGGPAQLSIASGSRLLESFTDTAIVDFMNIAAFQDLDITSPRPCPRTRSAQPFTLPSAPDLFRMYRSAKQPLPGMYMCVCGGGGCIR